MFKNEVQGFLCFHFGFGGVLFHFVFVGKDLNGFICFPSDCQNILLSTRERQEDFFRDALKLFSVYSLKYLA